MKARAIPGTMGLRLGWAVLGMVTYCGGASYHLAVAGDDSRSALEAQNPATPWQNFAKLAAVTLVPGDSVLLERGGVWRQTLRLYASGTATAPIVVAAYGVGGLPEIRGTQVVTAAVVGGRCAAKVGGLVKAVFHDAIRWGVSRYPDTGYLHSATREGDTALRSAALAGVDWTGASIHLRVNQFALESRVVQSGTGGRLSFAKTAAAFRDSVGFFLNNHPAAMGGGKWYQLRADSVLHWKSSESGTDSVEVAVREYGVDLRNLSYVEVHGIRIFGTALSALRTNGNGIVVEACELLHPGQTGVDGWGRDYRVERNRIVGATNMAIRNYGGPRFRAAHNTIRRTAQMDWLGPDGMTADYMGGRAINIYGDSVVICGNDIDSSGYSGIVFRGINSVIDSNVVAHSCMVTDDGGAIYTNTGKYANPGSANSVIRHNLVRETMAAPTNTQGYYQASHGIYLDDASHDMLVEGNTSTGSVAGIFLHNTQRVLVRNNVVQGNQWQIKYQHDTIAGVGEMSGNVVEANVFVSDDEQLATVVVAYQGTNLPQIEWRANTYCSDRGIEVRCRLETVPIWQRTRLAANSTRLGPETQANFGFDAASSGWIAGSPYMSVGLESGAVCGAGACLKARYAGDPVVRRASVASNTTIALHAEDSWRLSFRARGIRTGQELMLVPRRSHDDWMALGTWPSVELDTVWTDFALLLRGPQTDPKAALQFTVWPQDSVFWLDDVSLRAVTDSVAVTLPRSRLLVNPGRNGLSVPLVGSWLDPQGILHTGNIEIGSRQAVVLFADGSNPSNVVLKKQIGLAGSRAHRELGGWVITGLRATATVVDVRGRVWDRLVPDAQGTAKFVPHVGWSFGWVHTQGKTIALPR